MDPLPDFPEPGSPEAQDERPSILITFQNSASYYTSYMGSNGTRTAGGRRKSIEVLDSPLPQGPIVVMNDYPTPPPVLVTLNNRKHSYDRTFQPFSGPPAPQGPPGPPAPPGPNLPPSRRGSLSVNTLELPKKRGSFAQPAPSASSRCSSPAERLTASRVRAAHTATLPPSRPHTQTSTYESATLPRGFKARPPRNSQSMPTLSEAAVAAAEAEQDNLAVPTPSPRPSVCSSAIMENGERLPLMFSQRSSEEGGEEWAPHQKPTWLSLNVGGDEQDKRRSGQRSVYVAEIWPSLVCILTAVLISLVIYVIISYLYTWPHPHTRTPIAPAVPKYPQRPPGYPSNYPYPPQGPYDHYLHYPQHHPVDP